LARPRLLRQEGLREARRRRGRARQHALPRPQGLDLRPRGHLLSAAHDAEGRAARLHGRERGEGDAARARLDRPRLAQRLPRPLRDPLARSGAGRRPRRHPREVMRSALLAGVLALHVGDGAGRDYPKLALLAKPEEAAPKLPSALPEAFQKKLDPRGVRLTGADGKAVCDVWLVSEVVLAEKPTGEQRVKVPTLPFGTLIGALQ